jgi:hypothetical protein
MPAASDRENAIRFLLRTSIRSDARPTLEEIAAAFAALGIDQKELLSALFREVAT